MKTPTRLMEKLAAELHADAGDRGRFLSALTSPGNFAPCVLWTGSAGERADFDLPSAAPDERLAWLPDFARRLAPGTEPGKHPGHAAGAFYSLDFSSVWAASAMLAADGSGGRPRRVLDLCAAPGGKSVFASLALGPALLLSNEVIGKRLAVLRHNLARCRVPNAFTQRLDPRDFAAESERAGRGFFDLVIADAPCSGQSLPAKGIENPGAFHPATVKGNAKRQAGILTSAAACVAPGGWLLYATCTFSPRENERVVERILDRCGGGLSAVEVPHLAPWRSRLAEFPCYRLHPDSGLGAGAFVALLRRAGEPDVTSVAPPPPEVWLAYPV
ncbi:MAG: RsmB/NOP family class I SAM-dependent RNA methyltransferase [Verrucomicrobiae bacterium]|nr:RsmB/NOP family class I SAM-dependent RNA methyltransferase [Verrucomicrobiae bacterium]